MLYGRDFSTQIAESLLLNIISQLIKLFIPAAINWMVALWIISTFTLFCGFYISYTQSKEDTFFLMVFFRFNVTWGGQGHMCFFYWVISVSETVSFLFTLSSKPPDAFFPLSPDA